MQINLKKIAAGYDLYADLAEPITVHPHTTAMISTGIAVEIPEGYFGGIFARSGLAAREMLRPGNCVGVVDSDYRNEIKVALHSDGEEDRVIERESVLHSLSSSRFFPSSSERPKSLEKQNAVWAALGPQESKSPTKR